MTTHTQPHPNPESNGLVQVVIQSIGTLHADALDLLAGQHCLFFNVGTERFRNPHHDPGMRELTGLDAPVRDHVLTTPGIMPMVERIAASTRGILDNWADSHRRVVHVVVACKGGRHRSVAVAEAAAEYLRGDGIGVEVEHRHITRHVVQR